MNKIFFKILVSIQSDVISLIKWVSKLKKTVEQLTSKYSAIYVMPNGVQVDLRNTLKLFVLLS